jgi:hypothetical protein
MIKNRDFIVKAIDRFLRNGETQQYKSSELGKPRR